MSPCSHPARDHRPVLFGRLVTGRFGVVSDDAVIAVWRAGPVNMVYVARLPADVGVGVLLAQNRHENRDRVGLEGDRRRAAQTRADLRQELEDLRITLTEVRPKGADGEAEGGVTAGSGSQKIPVIVKSTIAPLPSRELCIVIWFTKLSR